MNKTRNLATLKFCYRKERKGRKVKKPRVKKSSDYTVSLYQSGVVIVNNMSCSISEVLYNGTDRPTGFKYYDGGHLWCTWPGWNVQGGREGGRR